MALLTNSIGTYTFDDLQGVVRKRRSRTRTKSRQGATGTRIIRGGNQADPFRLISTHYVLNWAAVETALTAYRALIDDVPQAIVKHGVSHGSFAVLDAFLAKDEDAVINSVGTIIADAEIKMQTVWVLQG